MIFINNPLFILFWAFLPTGHSPHHQAIFAIVDYPDVGLEWAGFYASHPINGIFHDSQSLSEC